MQGVREGLQKAQLQTLTRDANGRARGATVRQSKASQPRAGPVPYDARAAEGLPPPALPPLQPLTGRVLRQKGLGGVRVGVGGGNGNGCPGSYRPRLACPSLCLLLSLLVVALWLFAHSFTVCLSVCRMERESASHNCAEQGRTACVGPAPQPRPSAGEGANSAKVPHP